MLITINHAYGKFNINEIAYTCQQILTKLSKFGFGITCIVIQNPKI